MNKILNINLGGMPFTIDIDAYNNLENYLGAIGAHFSDSESCDEILDDIEVRMGELFSESMKGSPIITNKELDEVIKVMGTPADFGATSIDEDLEEDEYEDYSSRSSSDRKSSKRLYRDGEDKVIGGVCSGIASYFGMDDPLWVRIAFVVLLFAGISPILYILLWVIVPKAISASDKLAMRGETINISNIAKTVEEEITELSNRITEIGKDLSNKKKNNGIAAGNTPRRRNFITAGISGLFGLIGGLFSAILGLVKGILKPVFKLTGGILVFALGVALIVTMLGISFSLPFIKFVGPDSYFMSSLGGLSLYMTLGIPLFTLLVLIAKSLFKYKINMSWSRSLGLVWFVSLILGSLSVVDAFEEYETKAIVNDTYVRDIDAPTIHLTMTDEYGEGIMNMGNIQLSGDGLVIDEVHIVIEKSTDKKIYVKKVIKSRGSNKKEARKHASKVISEITINDDGVITIPKKMFIPKGEKYRGQEITYTISIPKGKNIKMDKSVSRRLHHTNFDNKYDTPYNMEQYQWEMTTDGISSAEYNYKSNFKLDLPIEILNTLFITGKFDIDLVKSDKAGISIVGEKSAVEQVIHDAINSSVHVTNPQRYSDPIKLYVYVTDLQQLTLKDIYKVRLEGLVQKNLAIYNTGSGDIYGVMEIDNLVLHLDGRQDVDLMGHGSNLELTASRNVQLHLEKYKVHSAEIKGILHNGGKIFVQESLTCNNNNLRRLNVLGNPKVMDDTINSEVQM